MEMCLFQDGGHFKRGKNIHHHGPRQILNICHLPAPLISHYPLPLNTSQYFFYSTVHYLRDGHQRGPKVGETAVEGDLEHRLFCQPANSITILSHVSALYPKENVTHIEGIAKISVP
jgi:hypothetical protein